MKQDDLDKDLNDLISDSRTLFGNVEEMDKEEIMAILNESGSLANTVRDKMYARIEAVVKDLSVMGMSTPQRYLDILNQLSSASAVPGTPKTLVERARECVAELLQGPDVTIETELRFSFHQKGEETQSLPSCRRNLRASQMPSFHPSLS